VINAIPFASAEIPSAHRRRCRAYPGNPTCGDHVRRCPKSVQSPIQNTKKGPAKAEPYNIGMRRT
jgi:hypothetical protein